MIFMMNIFQRCKTIINYQSPINEMCMGILPQSQQIRNKWPDHRMIKDARKRNTIKDYGVYKLRYNAIRKNDIIPSEIQEIADKEIYNCPKDASIVRIVQRCQVTSRPRGNVKRWRLSRIIFRHLADYNKLAGVQRAMW
ncbi:28S ribosomal protein S14, mitochondrial isoform X1 [Daktulosphaira vitifoliae]|uniref:28S ribosomal protein S14, mitochondrial isoform X1 n=2 Tax=Daktulosphaira vitifoliae TaxID=58002 RepID=UPI0021A9D682|nr:28S ribosomal protein S14, mitochondrial isoform X1 [Daktulosphaira vitifoliae]